MLLQGAVTVRGVLEGPLPSGMLGKPAVEKLNSGTEETVSDTAIVDACVVKPARVGGRTGVTVTGAEKLPGFREEGLAVSVGVADPVPLVGATVSQPLPDAETDV